MGESYGRNGGKPIEERVRFWTFLSECEKYFEQNGKVVALDVVTPMVYNRVVKNISGKRVILLKIQL